MYFFIEKLAKKLLPLIEESLIRTITKNAEDIEV